MRIPIVLLFAVLGCAGQASAASEQSYIAARDSYMARNAPARIWPAGSGARSDRPA